MNIAIGTRILLALAFSAQPGAAQNSARPDEAPVRELIGQYVSARNSEDVEALRALLTGDVDQLVSSGEWRKGIEAVVKGAAASSKRESGRSITVESVRFITADVALVDARYETRFVGSAAIRKMWTTMVVARTGSGWRIAGIRNMLPAALPDAKPH